MQTNLSPALQLEVKETAASESMVKFLGRLEKVPEEYVVKDPSKVPNRCWGDDDDSWLNFELPTFDMSPLMVQQPRASEEQCPDLKSDAMKREEIIEGIGKASENWGFFHVVNHGISVELLDRVIELGKEFFDLPLEEMNLNSAKIPKDQSYGKLDFGKNSQQYWTDLLRHHVRPKTAIEENEIPKKPAAYRSVIEEFSQGLDRIFQVVGQSLWLYLGLEAGALQKAHEDDSYLIIRQNYYPKCPEPEKVLGMPPHKDSSLFTAILQENVGGLQTQLKGNSRWLDVKPTRGAILIQIGYSLEILSNGRFHSPLHRVLANRNSPRLSVGAFLNPAPKCTIRPTPELLEKYSASPRYRQFVFRDYLPNYLADYKAGLNPNDRYEIKQN